MRYITLVTIFLIFLSVFIVIINPKFPQKVQIQSVDLIPLIYSSEAKEKDFIVDNKDTVQNTKTINTQTNNAIQQVDNITTKDIELERKWQKLLAIAEEEQQQTYSQKPDYAQKSDYSFDKYSQNSNPKITTSEENIAWNKWRANLANHIVMSLEAQGAAKYIPVGTQYIYTFRVSGKGEITNISVGTLIGANNSVTQQGAAIIKDTIQSFNYDPILRFPIGSQRNSVNVLSGMRLTYGQT